MANFLEQFENKNYKNAENFSKNEIADKEKKQSFTGIQNTEHDVVIDSSYNRHKTIRIAIISTAVLLLFVFVFISYKYFDRVQVLNFEGKNITEARTWALKNQIELDEEYAFNNSVSTDLIISQSTPKGSKVAKKSVLTLTISKGANPDEKINVPDFSTLSAAEIQNWIDSNKLVNTRIVQEYSSTLSSGKYIKSDFRDAAVDGTNFKRKDYLTIYVSRGEESKEFEVVVPNLVNMSKDSADQWAASNSIILIYTEQISTTVSLNNIISQGTAPDTKVKSGSKISLTLSAGAGIAVPDFSKISIEEAPMIEPALSVSVKMQYSNTVPYGKLISQSIKAGQRVLSTNNKVQVLYSEGKPYIGNLVGTSEKDLAVYFYSFSQKGAPVTYTVTYVDSSVEKGTVVWTSKYNEFIATTDNILIKVSKGNLED